MILLRKEEILNEEAALDASEIHRMMRKIPDDLDIEMLIQVTLHLYARSPPSKFIMKRRHLDPIINQMIKEEEHHPGQAIPGWHIVANDATVLSRDHNRFFLFILSCSMFALFLAWIVYRIFYSDSARIVGL